MSATKASEDSGSDQETNAAAAAYSFFWQTPGSLAPWVLAIAFTYTTLSINLRWRLLLGLGSIPSFIVLLCVLSEKKSQGTSKPNQSTDSAIDDILRKERIVSQEIVELAHKGDLWFKMLGTGGCWFIYDIAYYGNIYVT